MLKSGSGTNQYLAIRCKCLAHGNNRSVTKLETTMGTYCTRTLFPILKTKQKYKII